MLTDCRQLPTWESDIREFSRFKAANAPELSDWDKGYTLAAYYLDTEEFSPQGESNPADCYTLVRNNEADDTFRISSNTSINNTET